jgi:TPR repeat protein
MESGLYLERVVAVVAVLSDGREQVGSGYLVSKSLVLTAAHCTRDIVTDEPATALRVFRASNGAISEVHQPPVVALAVDLAALTLDVDPSWTVDVPVPTFARLDRSRPGILDDCPAIGFPLWQRNPTERTRGTAELHGVVYQTDEAESGRLLMREPRIRPGRIDTDDPLTGEADSGPSPWGGLSGALIFHAGQAIGVVVEHHPRQGDSALRAIAFDTLARKSLTDPGARDVAQLLALPPEEELAWTTSEPIEPLVELVELFDGADLPLVESLTPYLLGATITAYGDDDTHGQRDPYVPRTHNNVDTRLCTALEDGHVVLIVGPSKAGKTRTAYEAINARWPDARLLAPRPNTLAKLIVHPRLITTNDHIVVWLDDLQRYLTVTDALTSATLAQLMARSGVTIVLATLRDEERARLAADTGEVTRETRLVLERASPYTFVLRPTSDDPDERAAASAAYPAEDLDRFGLAEQLAGGPALVQQYQDARSGAPLLHAVIQATIDWARVGMPGPLAETDLAAITQDLLLETRPDLDVPIDAISASIAHARKPPPGAGRVAPLETVLLANRTRGYRPFSYLVAADDGQVGDARTIPESAWEEALRRADPREAVAISYSAYTRTNPPVAVRASTEAATAGETFAMVWLGGLLADWVDPPKLDEARRWLTEAASAGQPRAMTYLAHLLADRVDPPELDAARDWYTRAAQAGNTGAMLDLGLLLANRLDPAELKEARDWLTQAAAAGSLDAMSYLAELLATRVDPPELDAARDWYTRAAEAGNTDAMFNLGFVLSHLDLPELDEARHWYTRAAEAGDSDAMVNLGLLLATRLDPPELDEARHWYTRAAEAGDSDAMNNLGDLLLHQLDPPELDEARHWYTRAAEAGNTNAMKSLGDLLSDQMDSPELDEARHWYTQAATTGETEAMVKLGLLLAFSLDPPVLAEARHWLTQAATAGEIDAMVWLGILLASRVDPPELDEARHWYTRAATAGDTGAMVILAVLLADRLTPPELDEARRWYEEAAMAGETDAMVQLAGLLADRVDPPDLDEARHWYTQAAEAGDTSAMYNLGILLSDRLDSPELDEARRWYSTAAEAGDTDAMVNLGNLLSDRLDPPEPDEARRWYLRAAEAGDTDAMNSLGGLSASAGDQDGARSWWQAVIDASIDTPDETTITAMINLAAFDAFTGDIASARSLLGQATEIGSSSASDYAATLNLDPQIRDEACHVLQLAAEEDDTDALNFLGLAAYTDGREDEARQRWAASAELDDAVAPLLLHLAEDSGGT